MGDLRGEFRKHVHTNTHRVVFFDVPTDVEQQFVADVDRVVDGPTLTGDVAASHQAGLHVESLHERWHTNSDRMRSSTRVHENVCTQISTVGACDAELR